MPITRRSRRLLSRSSLTGLGETELARLQHHALNRMRVYDAAPKRIRLKVHDEGDTPLLKWWNNLQEHQQVAILDGRPCPKRKPKEELDWREHFADWLLRK